MNKDNNIIVPKLRFPEFLNDGEWNQKALGSLAKLVTEKAGTIKYKLMSVTAGSGLVSQMDKFGREIAGESYKNYYVIRKWDFTYNKSSVKLHPEGQIAILENEDYGAVPNSIFTCFRVDENLILPSFLKFPFENNIHGKWLRKFISIGARANGALNVDNIHLLSLPITFPSLLEQKKIADCLSSLDDLINVHSRKLEALKYHKKGLMQQLFPADGETVPKLRFKEFENTGEWVSLSLDSLGDIITGNTPSTSAPENYGGDRLFVSPADISENRYITKTKTTLTELGYSLLRHIKENSVLFVCIGSTIGKVAQNKYECTTNQQINSLVPNSDYLSDFIYSLLEYMAPKIASIAGKQAVPIVNKTLFSSVLVCVPFPEEQQKIAFCLSFIDEQITAQVQLIEKLKFHKKGLTQGLFPHLNYMANE